MTRNFSLFVFTKDVNIQCELTYSLHSPFAYIYDIIILNILHTRTFKTLFNKYFLKLRTIRNDFNYEQGSL